MIRVFVGAVFLAGLAALLLLQLESTTEVVAWEVMLVALVVGALRLMPRGETESVPSLFNTESVPDPRPPRSVSSFELSAIHAFSESPGADRRIKSELRRIASHRLRRRGIGQRSMRTYELVDRSLWDDGSRPLSSSQIKKIVNQLEDL